MATTAVGRGTSNSPREEIFRFFSCLSIFLFYRFLSAEDVQNNLAIFTPKNYNGTLEFTLTAVVFENDGDSTFNTSDSFFVDFLANPDDSTASDKAPEKPTLDVGLISNGENVGLEDGGGIVLSLNATQAANETTNPVVTVTITDVPTNFQIVGEVIYNPLTDEYSATADAINAGLVRIVPPADFGGVFNITVEAVATSALSTSSDEKTLFGFADPRAVGDGYSISAGPSSGFEDTNVNFTVDFASLDSDGSERLRTGVYTTLDNPTGAWWYIRWDFTFATFVFNYTIVQDGDPDEILYDLEGYYRIPINDTDLVMQLLENWHGTISGNIRVPVEEKTSFSELGADTTDDFILSSR